ncbi:MAG: hypothetical protein QXS91_03770 [Candidatus Anstonellales archaeon]
MPLSKTDKKFFEIIAINGLIAILSILLIIFTQKGEEGHYHIHIDFKVFLDGQEVNFSKPEYMSEEGKELSKIIHLHDMNGNVLHIHSENAKLEDFFKSINMTLTDNCLITKNKKYCGLKLYVNRGVLFWIEQNISTYKPKDLDRILITDGKGNIEEQKNAVTDEACIPSNRCFWRGVAKEESSCSSNSVSCPV